MSSKTKLKKVSKRFYKLCYSQYRLDIMETDQIYQRASVVLILLPLLGVLTYNLGRIDILSQLPIRIDVFLYYLFTFMAYLFLGCSIVFAICFTLPRKNEYETLDSTRTWKRYKHQCLKQRGAQSKKNEDAIFYKITKSLAEILANNESINETRKGYFHQCFLMASLAIGSIGIQAIFYLLLKIQNI